MLIPVNRRKRAASGIAMLLCAVAVFSGCSWLQSVFGIFGASGKAKPGAPREVYLAPNGAGYDLTSAAGIHVKTNGQYKTDEERHQAAEAIDRYWGDLRKCALQVIGPDGQQIVQRLLPEFPNHLSVEIANDWRVIEGPVTHRRQQAFPSPSRPGAWVTASREEEALYVKVVPELNGLGRQMAGELNLWLSGHTSNMPTDFSNRCAELPCHRFGYNNSPSEAWSGCS